jgi:hypothetical protein
MSARRCAGLWRLSLLSRPIAIGTLVNAGLQLTAVAAVIAAMLIIDARRAPAKVLSHI